MKRPPWRKWLPWVGGVAVILLAAAAAAWFTCGFQGCPDPEVLQAWEPGGAPVVLDREGREVATMVPVQREIVQVDSLPEHVGQAFIAVEDRRFRSHGGVDVRRVFGALLANIREGGVAEGGSTITMQLARNAFPEKLPASQRTIRRKISEAKVATEIEDTFDKDQILGLYLNQIYFGNGATGIAAAANHYFGVPATGLTVEQAAMLAAMVKAPAHYDPRDDPEEALERRNLVLDLMGEAGFLEASEVEAAKETEIDVVPYERQSAAGESLPAPWFLEGVRRAMDRELSGEMYGSALRVHTTLDLDLQEAAEEALEERLRRVESGALGSYRGAQYDPRQPPDSAGSAYLQGAVVVLEPNTGGVLALVGGRNHRHSGFDHVFDARRQIGSAFKPFVYGAAVEAGIPPSHVLDDSPVSIELRGSPTYEPRNYDGTFEGPMTAREALKRSRNVPTVRLAQEVGTGEVADFARRAGIEGEIPEGPSMALGTVTLSPMELARAYATLAGLGRSAEPRFITRVETADGRTVWTAAEPGVEERIDPRVAYVLTDMLREVVDGGTGSAVRAMGFSGPAAGKTGTTQDAADVWFVGYTPDAVGVVWMGFDQPEPILPNATGGGLAAPVWGRMMARAGRSGAQWSEPGGVVTLPYDPRTGEAVARDCPAAAGAPTDLFLEDRVGGRGCPEPGIRDSLALDTAGWSTPDSGLLRGDSLAVDTADTGGLGPDVPRPDTGGPAVPPRDTGAPGRDVPPPDTGATPPDTTRATPPDTSGAPGPPPDTSGPPARPDTSRAPGAGSPAPQGPPPRARPSRPDTSGAAPAPDTSASPAGARENARAAAAPRR